MVEVMCACLPEHLVHGLAIKAVLHQLVRGFVNILIVSLVTGPKRLILLLPWTLLLCLIMVTWASDPRPRGLWSVAPPKANIVEEVSHLIVCWMSGGRRPAN